ncbi:unnamed protein product [Lactuca saligna]|uniref:Uncharacterized protein n=1 Tax=Lactuca saligna TaxID=75948 RepID=A0AA35V8F7_LACSI|nr:unnamed protein product [Lactuca saligna]
MGNCQAAEAATVVIMHPGNKIERIYKSVSARHVMSLNPGHYVAVVVTSQSENGLPVKQLKLLRPDDPLVIGRVYRLIRFEDVLKEFAAKKCVKLGKLLKERGVLVLEKKGLAGAPTKPPNANANASSVKSHKVQRDKNNRNRNNRRRHNQHQWKPALNSISENED